MSAPGDSWTAALDALAALRGRWPGGEWTWDGRLACAVSAFPIAQEPEVRRELAREFPADWTADTLDSAPADVTALARRCGGLREGQLLLCRDAAAGALVFALWWPWGDGSKVSVRIGLEGAQPADALTSKLREVFQAA